MSLRSLAIILPIHLYLPSLGSTFATISNQLLYVSLRSRAQVYVPLQQRMPAVFRMHVYKTYSEYHIYKSKDVPVLMTRWLLEISISTLYRSTMWVIVKGLETPWSARENCGCTCDHLGAQAKRLGAPGISLGPSRVTVELIGRFNILFGKPASVPGNHSYYPLFNDF